ncbi:sulfatase-like hydrolase/transferase [Candidatus Poribacteria bacterium]
MGTEHWGTINRRTFLKGVAMGTAGVAFSSAFSGGATVGDEKNSKPNIIFIMADDLGYNDLGCYGQEKIQTKNVDKMAAEGIRFTQCYTGSTVCAPSRSVLMTGQHTGHTRVRGNGAKTGGVLVTDNGGPQRRVPLEAEDFTVAELLKEAGYATGITGKWGLAEPETDGLPNRKGFDEWFGYLNQRRAHTYYPPYLWRNEEKVILEGNKDGKREEYSHDMFTQFALDFIQRHKEEPFFLYLPYTIPHARYEIPSIAPYEGESWSDDAKVHAAMVTRMDADVGQIMALLKELDIDEQTIVFFCSDNGAAQRWEGTFDSSGPLRGKKGNLYEGGIRTPMIVRWPNRTPVDAVSDGAWYFADFLPTVAELVGAKSPSNIDGISVMPMLLGKEQDQGDRFLYWEHFGGGFQQAVRWGNWKAVKAGLDRPLELYDLTTDLGEENNVADQNPDVVRSIEDYLTTARTDSEYWPVP